jgi:peptide/nickel transport system substrate-binding protein
MFSPTFYQEHGDDYCKEHPCGTGPFTMTDWTRDVSKTFEARKDYWGGQVKLDGVKYIIYTDALVAASALQSGEIDAYLAPDAETATSLSDLGYEVKTCTVKSHDYLLCFNSLNQDGTDPTGDLKVRQAISYAIDTDGLVQAVWGDYANVRNQFGVGKHFYSDKVIGYNYDPDKAKELLASAGYPDGFEISLKTEDSSALKNGATIIQEYLDKVGIKVDITILSGADGNEAEAGWGDGLWLHGSSVYVSAPMQMASMFRKNLDGHVLGLTNLLRPDDVDAALATSVAAASDEEAVEAVGEANHLLVDTYCIFDNLAEVATLFVVNDNVKDSGIGDVFYSVADLGNAWLSD